MKNTANTKLESIIDSLYQTCKPSVFNLFQHTAMEPSLVKEVESLDDPNALYSLIPFMFVKNKIVSRLARNKINSLLDAAPIHHLNKIDERIRRGYFSPDYPEMTKYWYNLTPRIVDAQNSDSTEHLACLKILCCHTNGYIRYKAIKSLTEKSIQDGIPFLIIRLNDWVDEIRSACLIAVNDILKKNEEICRFVDYLPLLNQLKTKGRYDQVQLAKQIELTLVNKCIDKLFTKINSKEIRSARYAFTIIANSAPLLEELLRYTLDHKDIIIKLRAFELAKKQYDPEKFLTYLNKLKNDKLMPLRRNALYAFVEYYPVQSKNILEHALLDRSRTIRNLSRCYLKKQGVSDFSNYYKDALVKHSQTLKPAILGLSESGSEDDFSYIRPFLKNDNVHLNAAIISAAFKMHPEDWKDIVCDLLSDPDPATLRSFANCILEKPNSYSFDEVLNLIYKKSSPMHVRYFIKILTYGQYDRWASLNFVLSELVKLRDKDIKIAFEDYLHRWIYRNSPNKVFVRPSNDESRQCLEKATHLLKDNSNNQLYKALLGNIKRFI